MRVHGRTYLRRRLILLFAVSTLLAVMAPAAHGAGRTFTDDDDSIFEADIEWLADAEITAGCNPPVNDHYCPNSNVTRGQMAAFLVRAMELADDGRSDLFVDDDASIFEGDIDRLGASGISRGCNPPDNDRFCPTAYVTRGQMAAFLVRALNYTDAGDRDRFHDDDGSTFETDINKLATAGITSGCNPPVDDRFCPNDYVTRGQMAAFLHRALFEPPVAAGVEAYIGDLPKWGDDSDPSHGQLEYSDEPDGPWSSWSPDPDESDYMCRQRDFTLQTTPEEIVTFNLASNFLWPGVLVEGDSYSGGIGTIQELPIRQRAPVAVFVDFSRGDIRRVVVDPTPGRIAAAVGDIVEQADAAGYQTGTKTYFRKHETHQADQMAAHLGLSIRYMASKLKTSLDMERSAAEDTLTVYFVQTAFTAEMERPQTPGGFFSGAFTPELLAEQVDLGRIGPDNLPVYVSSVTYGRILSFSVTSTKELSKIEAAISGVYNDGSWTVEGDVGTAYEQAMENSTTEFVAIGGSSAAASAAISSGQFEDYFAEGVSLTEFVPISYVLKDLKGNTAYLGDVVNYTVEECEPAPDEQLTMRVTFDSATLVDFNDGAFDDDVELDRFFLYAQAYNRIDNTEEPGTPIFGDVTWCGGDPAEGFPPLIPSEPSPSTERVFCWYDSGYDEVTKGSLWMPPEAQAGLWYLDIPYDNSAISGGVGNWLSDTLRLRAATRDYDASSGNEWTNGWSLRLTGQDVENLSVGENNARFVFRVQNADATWDIQVTIKEVESP